MDSTPTLSQHRKPLTAIAAALAIVATVLGFISAGPNEHGWDISLARWIQKWEGSLGESLYNIGDMLGTTSLAATITAIALIIAIVMKRVQISIFLLMVLLLRLAGTQLKPLFDSPRPTTDHLRILETFDGTGYPSGHSMTVAMVAAMLVMIAWRYMSDVRMKWAMSGVAAVALILVGWSRVWSGAHWPSDVLGGWSYGVALVLIAWILADAVTARILLRQDTAVQIAKG